MVPPGETGVLCGLNYLGEELLPFHHYNSQEIIYEQPRRAPRFYGGIFDGGGVGLGVIFQSEEDAGCADFLPESSEFHEE